MTSLLDKTTSCFKEKLKHLIDPLGLRESELARKTGIPETTIRDLLKGNTDNPTATTLVKLASFFNVSVDYLLGLEQKKIEKHTVAFSIKGKSSMLVPIIEWDWIKEYNLVREDLLMNNHSLWIVVEDTLNTDSFALHAGDNLIPIFPKNSILLVEPQLQYKNNDYVIASSHKKKPCVRKFIEEGEDFYIAPFSLRLPPEKVHENVVIFGKIVETRLQH